MFYFSVELNHDFFMILAHGKNINFCTYEGAQPEIIVDGLAHFQLANHEVQKVGRAVSDPDADDPRRLLQRLQKYSEKLGLSTVACSLKMTNS